MITYRFRDCRQAHTFYKYLYDQSLTLPDVHVNLDANDVLLSVTSEHAYNVAARLVRDAILATSILPVAAF